MNDRALNETAIRDYALECSKKFRAGLFRRVGEPFLDEVKADVEALVRGITAKYGSGPHQPLFMQDGQTCPSFATGALIEKIEKQVNEGIAKIVQAKVSAQPSCGCTLGRTR